jgi:hypothetical protein
MSVEAILTQVQDNAALVAYFQNKEEAVAWIDQF